MGDIAGWVCLSETAVWIEVPVHEPARTPLFTLAYSDSSFADMHSVQSSK